MIGASESEFVAAVDNSFFTHIRKRSVIQQGLGLKREEFLKGLYHKVVKGSYFAEGPRELKVESKLQRVTRIVPLLSVADYCVYYFCIKMLEDDIALDRVEGTFGGFSLGGQIRKSEENELEAISLDQPSTPSRAFNLIGWNNAWKDFQKKIWLKAKDSEASEYLMSDIANFYDTIDLDKLEVKVRNAIPKGEKQSVVHLLFSFLRNWNRKIYGYAHQTKGIPQDEVGDCSRILANFFLQDFDRRIKTYCDEHEISYFRYADDLIFMSDSKEKNLQALYESSVILHKEGLNLNASKVQELSEPEFLNYWAFEIFEQLDDPADIEKVNEGAQLYRNYCKQVGKGNFRWHSVLSRLATCKISVLDIGIKNHIYSEVLEDAYLLDQGSHLFKKIYDDFDAKGKKSFVIKLKELATSTRFNGFIMEVLDFNRKCDVFNESFVQTLEARLDRMKL